MCNLRIRMRPDDEVDIWPETTRLLRNHAAIEALGNGDEQAGRPIDAGAFENALVRGVAVDCFMPVPCGGGGGFLILLDEDQRFAVCPEPGR